MSKPFFTDERCMYLVRIAFVGDMCAAPLETETIIGHRGMPS